MKKYLWFFPVVIFLSTSFVNCKKKSKAGTFYGDAVTVGNGKVRTYVTLNDNGEPEAIGFKFSESMLSGLPDQESMSNMQVLNFPSQAPVEGYDHAELDWNPHGHDPIQIYGFPHFDFHFYSASTGELSKIIPGPDTVALEKQYVPTNYVSGVMAVPNMGVHWVDTLSSEFQGKKFTSTFIYGFYHGQYLFIEPMITKEYLESHPDISTPVKQPAAFQKPGFYPTKWSLHYDAQKHEYTVSLEGLVKH